jgi:phosphatidate cytidylyltransferase
MTVLVSMVGQGGDLLESALKRHFKVKDSGGLIPGHGGVLDRVDAQMTVIPLVALTVLLSGGSVLAW